MLHLLLNASCATRLPETAKAGIVEGRMSLTVYGNRVSAAQHAAQADSRFAARFARGCSLAASRRGMA